MYSLRRQLRTGTPPKDLKLSKPFHMNEVENDPLSAVHLAESTCRQKSHGRGTSLCQNILPKFPPTCHRALEDCSWSVLPAALVQSQ